MEILFNIFNILVECLRKENGYKKVEEKRNEPTSEKRNIIKYEVNEYDFIISSHIVYFLRWIRVVPEEEIPVEVFQIIEEKMISKSREFFIDWQEKLSQPEKEKRFVECKESEESLLLQSDFSNTRHIVLEVVNTDIPFGNYMQNYFDQISKS